MADLTPRTRSESFLNGEDLEPITRREHFYAGRENELPEGHQEPETREEWFIQKYREAGDVTVESLSITENGTYTAPSGKAYSPVSVNVPLPSNAYLLKSIEHEQVATFADGTDNFLKSLEVAIEPQQDLHGYDSPWVGGSGKNKLPINSLSIAGSGITATIDRDSNNNVVSVTVNGTASGTVYVILNTFTLPSGTYTMSGCPSNGGTNSYRLYDDKHTSWADDGSGASFTLSEASQVIPTIRIASGYTVNNLKFYPMIESGSTATAYAPYSNECPISGWDEVNVTRCGKNLLDVSNAVNATNVVDSVEADGTIHFKDVTATWSNTHIGKIYVVKGQTYVISASNIQYGRFGFSTSPTTHPTDSTFPNIIIQSGASPSWIIGRVPTTRYFVANLTGYIYLFYCTDANYDSYHATFAAQIQIEIGETATTYEPYNGHTYTIDLDGTRYGGKLDVVSGVLTVTHQIVDLGDATWSYSDLTNVFDTSKIASSVVKPTSSTEVIDLQCSMLVKNSSSGITSNPSVDGIAINTLGYIIARYSGMPTSSADFRTAVTGQKLKFPLATPLTYQLTPTIVKSLQGNNNFFASTGEVERLQYWGKEVS